MHVEQMCPVAMLDWLLSENIPYYGNSEWVRDRGLFFAQLPW